MREQSATPRVLALRPLAADWFGAFGAVLESDTPGFVPLFHQPQAAGWQAAINTVVDRCATTLHRHPDTHECFVAWNGRTVLLVAPAQAPEQVSATLLDAPVCIAPQVWHTLLAPSGFAQVFICENATVTGVSHRLAMPITAGT